MSTIDAEQDPFTCLDGEDHDWIPDGGCKTCRKCGFSPCA